MRIFKTSQGRSSLFLAFKTFARKDKKFVITQAFTCVAVPESIIASGYKPLWVDIELDTFSMSEESFNKIFDNYKNDIACILIQHTYGLLPINYKKMISLGTEFDIPIIEDRCHCNFLKDYSDLLGSESSKTLIYCYSFENAKPIKLGRGGILLTNNANKQELKILDFNYKYFKSQNPLKSLLHLIIAINYVLFSSSPFYWPLLTFYRLLAKNGILPSNFKSNLNNMDLNKMGIFQSYIISCLIYFIKVSKKNIGNSIAYKLIIKLSNYFLKRNAKYPIYVNNKKNVINYCKKNLIYVKEYFNSPIQPLNESNFDFAFYKINLCKIAEEASKHVVAFDRKPNKTILSKIKSL